jgi:hypothetical protein
VDKIKGIFLAEAVNMPCQSKPGPAPGIRLFPTQQSTGMHPFLLQRTNQHRSFAGQAMKQARRRLTKMLGPVLCQERKPDLKPRQGRNQREKQEQQAVVCLFLCPC